MLYRIFSTGTNATAPLFSTTPVPVHLILSGKIPFVGVVPLVNTIELSYVSVTSDGSVIVSDVSVPARYSVLFAASCVTSVPTRLTIIADNSSILLFCCSRLPFNDDISDVFLFTLLSRSGIIILTTLSAFGSIFSPFI